MPDDGALKLGSPADVNWDDEADILVIGFGAAGACAAIEGLDRGASVLVIDRFDGGGATAYSGGVIYAGVTEQQRAAGIADSVDDMARYLEMEVGDAVGADTLGRYCAESAANIKWLEGLGLEFGSSMIPDPKIPGPPSLLFGGNERIAPYNKAAKPAPRGHRVSGPGLTGPILFSRLKQAALGRGAKLRTHCWAARLVVDDAGRVHGVEVLELPDEHKPRHQQCYDRIKPLVPFQESKAERVNAAARRMEEQFGRRLLLRGRKGIILCTGGFTYNLDLLKQHAPAAGENLQAIGRSASIGDDGSAIRLGTAIGAQTAWLDKLNISKALAPPPIFLQGILVNRDAKRFAGETVYLSALGVAIAAQPEGKAWLILPKDSYRKAFRQILNSGWAQLKTIGAASLLNMLFGGTKKAASLRDLARKCSLDEATLAQTITRYNGFAAAGRDDDFSKLPEQLKIIEDGPCVALDMSLGNRFGFMQVFTLGGLKVDERSGAVTGPDGAPIAGLYAAGRAAVGLPSNGYISGLSLGDCIFSGRRAAGACI